MHVTKINKINIYAFMHVNTINKKEAMNLKENKARNMGLSARDIVSKLITLVNLINLTLRLSHTCMNMPTLILNA